MSIANLISKVTGVVCVPDRLAHPRDAVTLDLSGYSQIDDFSCGAVAGWIVLEAFDRRRSFRKFYDCCSPKNPSGTSTPRLAHALCENGLGVQHLRHRISFARLCRAIDDGLPVICCVDHDKRDDHAHWLVVYGYQERPARVFVAGNGWLHLLGFSLMGEHVISRRRFERMRVTGALICWGQGRGSIRRGIAPRR
ncbi:MAG: hypothetical protein RIS76_3308 [Verrucomicrobiota bacterium]|jgi:hypothetical protein